MTTLNAVRGNGYHLRYGVNPLDGYAQPRLGVLKARFRAMLGSLRWDPMTREEREWDRVERMRARLDKEWP